MQTKMPDLDSLLSQMTFEEKLMQLSCTIFPWGNFPVKLEAGQLVKSADYATKTRHGLGALAYINMSIGVRDSVRYTNALQKDIIENTRLGIPLFILEECCHGQLAQESTVFPIPPSLAATFDPDLVGRIFDAIGRETRVRGGNYALSPVLDLARDPRWGRSDESFSEDTYLASRMGVAAVRGMQGGEGVRPTHVAASPKHFAGFGQSAGGRQMAPADIGIRVMLDEILPPFRAAVVEGKAAAIMPAYLEIDGVPAHANYWLLTEMLRKRWGFTGVVGSDFGGIERNRETYRLCATQTDSARLALLAGNDMDFPGGTDFESLLKLPDIDRELMTRIDDAVARVLKLKLDLGLFDHPYQQESIALETVHSAQHQQLALEAAEKSIILLKNTNALLPLKPEKLQRIALIGPHSKYLQFGGVSPHNCGTNILDGLRDALPPSVEIVWRQGCALTNNDEQLAYLQETAEGDFQSLHKEAFARAGKSTYKGPHEVPLSRELPIIKDAVAAAKESDLAILCLGESQQICGENYAPTRYGDRESLHLVGNQLELLKRIKATGKPVIVLLIHGRALEIAPVLDLADAVLDLWNIGEARGRAVAKALLGQINPGGKLAFTYPLTTGQIPVHYSQKATAWLREYAFQETRELLPFGFGLSYTTFSIDNLRLESNQIRVGEATYARIDVENTGRYSGDEVVQLYITDNVASVSRPRLLLKGFQRITLQPGEVRTVRFPIRPEHLAFHNLQLQEVIEPGTFTISVGPNSRDLITTKLQVI